MKVELETAYIVVESSQPDAVNTYLGSVVGLMPGEPTSLGAATWRDDAELIREIYGNPFSLPFVDPAWLTWGDATIVKIAQTIYAGRRFDAMPILADALEEAGCSDAAILTHCREKREHVRGCWVLDLLLGKS